MNTPADTSVNAADDSPKNPQENTPDSRPANVLHAHKIRTSTVSWHLLDTGEGTLDNVEVDLLLHGTGSSTHSWFPLMQHIKTPRRTLMVDLPGHGQSTLLSPPVRWSTNPMVSPLSLHAMTRALHELIDTLGVRINVIVGHSAGAAIACQLCLTQNSMAQQIISINGALAPLQGLPGLLFSPIARVSAASGFASRLFSKRLQDDEQVNRLLQNTGSRVSAEQREHYRALCRNEQHVTHALRMMASWNLDDLYRRLPELSVPVVWIAGERDRMIPPKDANTLQQRVPGSRAILIPDTGHLVHEERPDLVAPILHGADGTDHHRADVAVAQTIDHDQELSHG